MFITASEWRNEYGGKKGGPANRDYRPLPFDHCALSLSQFMDPVCTEEVQYYYYYYYTTTTIIITIITIIIITITITTVIASCLCYHCLVRPVRSHCAVLYVMWQCVCPCISASSKHIYIYAYTYSTIYIYLQGVVFDFVNLAEYIKRHGKNPITGEAMGMKDIIRLHMAKNSDGQWHCPVSFKTFNNNSSIAAIKTTGNVYSLDCVKELNIAPKNYTDLLTGDSFKRSDIIIIQDPSNPEISARRDINSFEHLKQVRATTSAAKAAEGTVRHNPTTSTIMDEMSKKQKQELETPTAKSNPALLTSKTVSGENTADVDAIIALGASIDEVCPGRVVSDQRAGTSFTSTAEEVSTTCMVRRATPADIREARWKKMREVGKKGYVQVQTNLGNLNVEVHCDCAQRTSWNFLTLCEREYYNGTIFHRLIPGFMVQGGDPTGTGTGGESAFGTAFRDEFDSRLLHDKRGILSMANSGVNTNKSQFFITFAPSTNLDYKHCVFGRVVGGNASLDRMEAIDADKNDVPTSEIKILSMHVMVNPIAEADDLLVEQIYKIRADKEAKVNESRTLLGKRDALQITGDSSSSSSKSELSVPKLPVSVTAGVSAGIFARPADRAPVGAGAGPSTQGVTVAAAAPLSQAERVAAFMRSQGGEASSAPASSASSNPLKKKKMSGDFSAW
jgi:peptidyl-prolyl cis-trans isomerase-like protein 2